MQMDKNSVWMNMKKKWLNILLMMAISLCVSNAHATGLLPSLQETIGISMPSLTEAIGRYPDEEKEEADGSYTEIYAGISEDDFNMFSEYLESQEATLSDYKAENGILSARILAKGSFIEIEYNLQTLEMKVTYPAGAYDEKLKQAKAEYEKVMTAYEDGKYDEAAALLINLRGYGKAGKLIAADANLSRSVEAAREARLASFRNVGSYAIFGSYEQDNNAGNGKEEIEWLVLDYDETNQKVLLLSRYGLDAKPYNTTYTSITWEECTLRKWLNQDFLNSAFTAEEQQAIQLTHVSNAKSERYSGYSTNGGNDTQDKVFLLSHNEAYRKYFSGYSERQTKPTAYAKTQGAYESSEDGNCWWWLRSPGNYQFTASNVNPAGFTFRVDHSSAVRPALWLDLTSDIF